MFLLFTDFLLEVRKTKSNFFSKIIATRLANAPLYPVIKTLSDIKLTLLGA